MLFIYLLIGCFASVHLYEKKDYCNVNCSKKTGVVCGSNGKNYQSHCALRKNNCLFHQNVEVQYHGDCECPHSCGKTYKPVCATNGKTFLNICQFKKQACKLKAKNKTLSVQKKGPCKPWVSKKCPNGCVDIWAPVCAMDGKTYSSICAVKLAGCKMAKPLKLRKIGYCKKGQCPESCPNVYRPMCANNGRLYFNECEMRLDACRKAKMLDLKKASKKSLCKNKCIYDCPQVHDKVCGSDAVTYPNVCELYRQNCKRRKKVTLLKRGPCDPAEKNLPNFVPNVMALNAATMV